MCPKRHNRGKTQWTITILYTAKLTHHDLKFHKTWWKSDKKMWKLVWTDGQTDRQANSYIPPHTIFAGGIQRMTTTYYVGSPDSGWDKHKNAVALKRLMESQPSPFDNWISKGNIYVNRR